MARFDPGSPWYHGSPVELDSLRVGSTITQNETLARVFSHKPDLVTVSDAGEIRHNGTQPGYMYLIAEDVRDGDVTPHPRTAMMPGEEWLTTRELSVTRLRTTTPDPEELLTAGEVASLMERVVESEERENE